MARVAIVSYDVQTIRGKAGGLAAFVTRWARLLRAAGEDVTIVLTRTDWEPVQVDTPWKARYQAWGIGLIELQAPPPLPTRWPEVPTMRVSELASPVLRNFDIVYSQDWGNASFDLVRARKYSVDQGPVCVTQIFGPTEWEQAMNELYPELPGELHRAYQERYAVAHGDFTVSSSAYMRDYLSNIGWRFPGDVALLGLPMFDVNEETLPESVPVIRKIVYFARIEERKGIRLFVKALVQLARQGVALPAVELFGGVQDPSLLESALRDLRAARIAVKHIEPVDSETSIKYLRDGAAEILCVVPSPSDNYPYTVVEASLIPGLNLVACSGGGVGQMFEGDTSKQLCEPYPRPLAEKISERLRDPLPAYALLRYDWKKFNAKWLEFHRAALASVQTRVKKTLPAKLPTVDVVSTYYQKAPYLSQFVDGFEHQTVHDFCVLAVNDGSPDEESNRVFAEQGERAAKHGWKFVRTKNQWVDAARNAAAALGTGDLLLFLDSDDVPARNAVERMREALLLSGDDCLVASSYLFASDKMPYDLETGVTTAPMYALCLPLGMDLVGAMVNPSSLGGSMFIVRRSAFEALGGYLEVPGVGHEDWELYVRLAMAGYKVDMMADLMQFYRQVEGGVARLFRTEPARRRLLEAYEVKLREVGLPGAALALEGLHFSNLRLEQQVKQLEAKVNAPQGGYSYFSAAKRRFESGYKTPARGRLQNWYRSSFSLETRLKIHQIFLAPLLGPYKPPPP